MRTRGVTRRWAVRLLSLAIALASMGCFNPFAPRIASQRGISEPAPVPDSPRNVLELFRWCWEHRDYSKYREVFTDDFRFAQAGDVDTTGSTDPSQVHTRDDELESAKHLFIGGKADEPPANRIILDFNSDLVALPDPRRGKTDPWHKVIQTSVTLSVDTDAQNWRITGDALFYVVSGDSAHIPTDLGFGADPNRWYIERWEDRTGGNEPSALARALSRLAPGGSVEAAIRSAKITMSSASKTPPSASRARAARAESASVQDVSWAFLMSIYH
jgi:hypothetical protein